jgi:hypothetical protein
MHRRSYNHLQGCASGKVTMKQTRDGETDPQPTTLRVENTLALLFDDLGHVPCGEHTLRAGERLLFYTDGITDRGAPDGSMYEENRLTAAFLRLGTLAPAPRAIADRLILELDACRAGRRSDAPACRHGVNHTAGGRTEQLDYSTFRRRPN